MWKNALRLVACGLASSAAAHASWRVAPSSGAELRAVVNEARLHGCTVPGQRAPLRDSAPLALAAARLANGESLHAALAAVGYLATQSSVLHLSGTFSDSGVSTILIAHYCQTLSDPLLTDMGSQRRGQDLWLVLAAPAALPRAADAGLIGRQILAALNEARATGRHCGAKSYGSAAALTLNSALTEAALAHSREMAAGGEFAHRGHDGSSPALRVTRAGYGPYAIVGENIAAGAMTPAEVMQGWLASPPHCENIMDPRFAEVGIAFAVNSASTELVYWTQDFAAPAAARAAQAAGRGRVNP